MTDAKIMADVKRIYEAKMMADDQIKTEAKIMADVKMIAEAKMMADAQIKVKPR